ncbi:MAG TPA: hypothetical protein VNC15_10790 [Solirubrobacterales bacterium]|nr:hypothetical protein [Solirubrobacterales bacterium]
MSKKIMLLALAVASVAMFALPAAASAQEIHLEGVTSFSGTAGAGSLAAEGEPTITCESGDIEGTASAGGTTGTISLDFTGCHTTVFGFTAKCRTTGSALDNTINTSGTFHLVTTVVNPTPEPDILVTPATTTIVCAGISNTVVHGNILGKITSPKCGAESKEMTTSFAATGTVQNVMEYTGVKYDLTATTGAEGAAKTAGLNSTGTTKSSTTGKLNCT